MQYLLMDVFLAGIRIAENSDIVLKLIPLMIFLSSVDCHILLVLFEKFMST